MNYARVEVERNIKNAVVRNFKCTGRKMVLQCWNLKLTRRELILL